MLSHSNLNVSDKLSFCAFPVVCVHLEFQISGLDGQKT